MKPDDELCLCFHVTRRKVENFLRVERPQAPAQLAECYGAGTGCGWCRPLLRKLFDATRAAEETPTLPDSDAHRHGRGEHLRSGGGVAPPGAAPAEGD